jgi:MFS family permease
MLMPLTVISVAGGALCLGGVNLARQESGRMKRMAHRLDFGLSRELWLIVLGIFLNSLGYGAVLPFEIIYLHDGRGFSLGIAGLVVAMLSGVAVVTAPLTGPLIDRFGARTIAAIAGIALAAGYAGLAIAATPVFAVAAAVLAGAGNGALNPSQSTLLAGLAQSDVRHRVTAVSRVAANAGYGIGGALGGLVVTYGLTGYIVLYWANALTYLVYVCVLVAVVRDGAQAEPMTGGYRIVVRDRAFMHLALTNVAIISVGWGVFTWVVPPYAKDVIGLSPPLIGLLLLANTMTVVVAQVPIARLAEGHRRVVMIALAAAIFFGACLLTVAARVSVGMAYAALLAASIAVGLGECFHTTVLMPLVADLAPPSLRGRYMAAMGLSWWVGLAVAPALGVPMLSLSPTTTFLAAAVVSLAAAVSALALERSLPDTARLTPHSHSTAATAPTVSR